MHENKHFKMPYIQKTNPETIKEQLYQWYGVMTDPRIDGFNGFACKQKIYEIKMECEKILQQLLNLRNRGQLFLV